MKLKLYQLAIVVVIILIILLLVGAIGFHYILDNSWEDSIYLAVVTMSSLSLETKPRTRSGKIFVAVFSFVSIGIYLVLIALIVAYFLQPYISKKVYLEKI